MLVYEFVYIVLNILGCFMLPEIKLDHCTKLVTELHQPHATLKLSNFEVSNKVWKEIAKPLKINCLDTLRAIENNKNVQVISGAFWS